MGFVDDVVDAARNRVTDHMTRSAQSLVNRFGNPHIFDEEFHQALVYEDAVEDYMQAVVVDVYGAELSDTEFSGGAEIDAFLAMLEDRSMLTDLQTIDTVLHTLPENVVETADDAVENEDVEQYCSDVTRYLTEAATFIDAVDKGLDETGIAPVERGSISDAYIDAVTVAAAPYLDEDNGKDAVTEFLLQTLDIVERTSYLLEEAADDINGVRGRVLDMAADRFPSYTAMDAATTELEPYVRERCRRIFSE